MGLINFYIVYENLCLCVYAWFLTKSQPGWKWGWGCTCKPGFKIYNFCCLCFFLSLLSHNLVESWVEVALVDRRLLLLNSLLAEHQPDFHVRVWQSCYGLLFNFDGTLIKCLTPGSQVLDDDIHIKKRFDKLSLTWFSVDIFCFQVSRLHNWDNFHILQSPTILLWLWKYSEMKPSQILCAFPN